MQAIDARVCLMLFDFDGCTGFGQLGLDLFGFVLGNAFFDGFRSPSTRSLASFRPRPATTSRTTLMTAILLPPADGQDDIKRVLFFSSRSSIAAACRSCHHHRSSRGRSRNTENFFEFLDQFRRFEKRHAFQIFNYIIFCDCHDYYYTPYLLGFLCNFPYRPPNTRTTAL